MSAQVRILSLGGGLQSTVIFLMMLEGRIPKADWVVFADTGSEQDHTLKTVAWVEKLCESNGINFMIVKNEKLFPIHKHYLNIGRVPMIGTPRCTDNFKIQPINKWIRSIIDESKPKPWAQILLGITMDESHRMRENPRQYLKNSFPLIELGLTRSQCQGWLNTKYPNNEIKKSGCWHCHYQPGKEWAKLRREFPELFEIAVEMEEAAKANGVRNFGLMAGRTIQGYDHGGITLEDFGFEIQPGDFDCSATGGCFL